MYSLCSSVYCLCQVVSLSIIHDITLTLSSERVLGNGRHRKRHKIKELSNKTMRQFNSVSNFKSRPRLESILRKESRSTAVYILTVFQLKDHHRTMVVKRALLVASLLTLQAAFSGGFYIPGVAPTEYDEGDHLIVKVSY